MAVYADPGMLEVTNLDHASPATILFQRGSVITTDIVLALGAKQCAQVGVIQLSTLAEWSIISVATMLYYTVQCCRRWPGSLTRRW